jgi:hypothetical protein
MTDLAQFSVLAALIIGGFGMFALVFTRLENRFDRLEDRLFGTDGEFKALRRDLAEEFRAQRAEVSQQITAIASAIIASRKE